MRGGVEAPTDAGERGAGHVDFRALGGFVGAERAADGAVDDVHARLARDDAHAARTDARVADVEIAALFGDQRIARELERLAVDAHEPVTLADDGIGTTLDIGGDGLAQLALLWRAAGSARVML